MRMTRLCGFIDDGIGEFVFAVAAERGDTGVCLRSGENGDVVEDAPSETSSCGVVASAGSPPLFLPF